MKTILITGSTGFIGSNLTSEFIKNYKVIALLRKKNKKISTLIKSKNILIYKNFLDLDKKISKLRIDFVIHCATHYVKKHVISDLQKLSESNILFGNIILENLTKMNAKKFINFSTVWEDYNGAKNSPHNLYAFYKKSFSEMINFYKERHKKTKFYNLMIADTFGYHDKRNKIITVLRKNYKKNKVTNIISKKLEINLINVKDIIEAVKSILNNRIKPSTYLLSNNIFNIKKLIDKFNSNNKRKIKTKYLSNKLLREKIYKHKKMPNWRPKHTSLNEILNVIRQ